MPPSPSHSVRHLSSDKRGRGRAPSAAADASSPSRSGGEVSRRSRDGEGVACRIGRYASVCVGPILALLLCWSIPAHAADHAVVERQFQAWLANDLWPDAAKLGVSEATFKAAFKGVSLNWKLPDLIPPGEKPRVPKVQHQAEFGSPGAYFAEGAIGP